MTRAVVKDWNVESIFRDLKLKGINVDENLWLKSKYRDFQEMEDTGLRVQRMYPADQDGIEVKVEVFKDFEYFPDPSQEGPTCSLLELIIRKNLKEEEE